MGSYLGYGLTVVYAGYGLVFLATFLVAHLLLRESESRAAQESLEDQSSRKTSNPLVKWTRPFFTQYVVPMIRGKKFWDERRIKYRRRIISAGLKEELTPDEYIAFKAILIVVFPLMGGFLRVFDLADLSWFTIVGSGILGWFYPDIWTKGLIEKRQKQVRLSLPFVVDLLALSTEAGLDFIGAIGKVVEKSKASPLIEELEQMLKEVKIGSSRAAALKEMATRLDMKEVNSFVAILVSAEQMGASIGKILRQQSEQIRSERFLAAEKAGAAAAQKLLIPIVVIVLPAVLLMIGGPFFLNMISGGGF